MDENTSVGYGTSFRPAASVTIPNPSQHAESTPLLPGSIKERPSWKTEVKTLGRYSGPFIVANMLQYTLSMSSMLILSPRGKMELGAASVATTTANITGFFVFQGLATSLDTLCGQAWGSGNPQLSRLYVQKMILALGVVSLPIALLWFYAYHLFSLVLPDPEISALAGEYLRVLICAIPGYVTFEAGKRILTSEGAFFPVMGFLCAGACTNAFLGWLLVWRCSLGFIGAPIAVAATWTLVPIYLVLYLGIHGKGGVWPAPITTALVGWGPMLKLALPGLVMVEAEFLAFEILVIASAQLSAEHLAAQTILALLNGGFWQIPFSIGTAGTTLIAQHIGAKSATLAKTSAFVVFITALIFSATNSALFYIFRAFWPTIFTDDPGVIVIVQKTLPLVAVMQLFDGMAACCNGILRGIGRPGFGGWVNLSCYYVVALPVSFWTTFRLGWGLPGLWFGVTISLIMVTFAEITFLMAANWQKSVKNAECRNSC